MFSQSQIERVTVFISDANSAMIKQTHSITQYVAVTANEVGKLNTVNQVQQ